MKKYFVEFIGTFLLVLIGCGVAVITDANIIATSMAFGIAVMVLSYAFSDISGCHLNPAVSLAMLINKKISLEDFVGYIVFQFAGAILSSIFLGVLLDNFNILGSNSFGGMMLAKDAWIALILEIILSFTFITVVLKTTEKESKFSSIIIGLSITLVCLIGIKFTGAGINPARSFGPAFVEGGKSLNQVWVFLLAPLLGSLLSTLFYKYVLNEK